MKKIYLFILIAFAVNTLQAQVPRFVNFDEINLPDDSFNNGQFEALNPNWKGFKPGGLILFNNSYDTAWGGFWSDGFAVSSKRDTATPGFTNLYSCITDSGNSSQRFAVAQSGASISLRDIGVTSLFPKSIMVNNSTYAALSMKNGDQFAKKFGGATGNDSDWFMLTITGYLGGARTNKDSITIMLADYRFADSTQDYILKTWTKVDLTPLGEMVDSIVLTLSSSDTGAFGMNTPAFFCIDNFEHDAMQLGFSERVKPMGVRTYPNPATNNIYFEQPLTNFSYTVNDITGKQWLSGTVLGNSIDVATLPSGMYFIQFVKDTQTFTARIVKQ